MPSSARKWPVSDELDRIAARLAAQQKALEATRRRLDALRSA